MRRISPGSLSSIRCVHRVQYDLDKYARRFHETDAQVDGATRRIHLLLPRLPPIDDWTVRRSQVRPDDGRSRRAYHRRLVRRDGYDGSLTPEERASEANGISMCQLHGKQIDDNASRHTAIDLKRWKSQHQEWVFARIASADSLLKQGITDVSIENIGPFRQRTNISLGRHNVVFGPNSSGKSSLCESVAAFAGGVNFENFRKCWRLFGAGSPSMMIEAAVSVNGARTTVRLSEELVALKRVPKLHQTRLHIEVDGNVAAHWPRSLFNIVYLDSQNLKPNRIKDPFRRDLRALAPQLGMSEDQVWDALREELFCSSTFGSRIRRIGEYRAEVRSAGSDFFYETGGLAGSQHTFALFDILLRMIQTQGQRPGSIVDSSLFLGLDSDNKRRLVEALTQLDEPAVQTLVCVTTKPMLSISRSRTQKNGSAPASRAR